MFSVRIRVPFCIAGGLVLGLAAAARAEEPSFNLTIKNHQYQPSELTIPAGVKIKLLVANNDDAAEEFESTELNREKIVAAGKEIVVYVGPLEPGKYPFFGDFHRDTAQGTLIAK